MVSETTSLDTPDDSEIVRVVAGAVEAVLGQPPKPEGVSFWTDAALLAEAGIPSVVLGPTGEGLHAEVEWVDIASVRRCAEILKATVKQYCARATETASPC